VNQPHLIRHLYRYLNESGLRAVTVSQERTKEQCKQALSEFTRGDAELLVTTDRAATGIDIVDVPWVLHFEVPRSTQAYVHRAGRTGRAGKTGHSVAFCVDEERIVIKRLEQELGIQFQTVKI
jgi:superfamily II DNA/RNA helicase